MIKKVMLSNEEKHHLIELVKSVNCIDQNIACEDCPFYCFELDDFNNCLVDKLREIADNN